MTSKFVTVNNIQLHYVEEGSGELVILLHGFPEFWFAWREIIPELSKRHRVVAPDMRGYNLSDKPEGIENYTADILAADIAALIRTLGAEKALLAGHDWGAVVAWTVASLHPEVVKKLAILNVPHPAEIKRAFYGFNFRQILRSYYIFLFQLPRIPELMIGKDLRKFFKDMFKGMKPKDSKRPDVPDTDIAKYVEAYSRPGVLTATLSYYRASLRNTNAIKQWPKLKMPVLMLWGEQDKALGKELTTNTGAYCEDLKTIYDPTSGHFIQHDNPDLVNRSLLEFFAS